MIQIKETNFDEFMVELIRTGKIFFSEMSLIVPNSRKGYPQNLNFVNELEKIFLSTDL